MKQSVFLFITLLIIKTLRIESSHRYRISFVVVKLLKDSVLKLAAYQPPFKHPRSRIITSVWSVIGLSRPRTATPTDLHLLSSRSACCVCPLWAVVQLSKGKGGVDFASLLFQPLTYRITDCLKEIPCNWYQQLQGNIEASCCGGIVLTMYL